MCKRPLTVFLMLGPIYCAAAQVPLTVANVNVARSDISIWNVKVTSAVRQGSTTASEAGKVTIKHRDGSSSTQDANLRVRSSTLFQDGEICHNYGTQCYCGTTTYRLESNTRKWKFAVPGNNRPVSCPSGIRPTGDRDIRKS